MPYAPIGSGGPVPPRGKKRHRLIVSAPQPRIGGMARLSVDKNEGVQGAQYKDTARTDNE